MLAFMGIYGKVISAVSSLGFAVLLLGLGTVSKFFFQSWLKIMENTLLKPIVFCGVSSFQVILILI